MGILRRTLVLELCKSIVPIWLGLGFLLFVLEYLAQVFRMDAPALIVLELYAYKIPAHLQLCFPVAVLLGALHVLGAMNRNRELVAVNAAGVGPKTLLASGLVAVGLLSIPHFWVTHEIAAWGMRKHYETHDVEIAKSGSRFSQIRQERIWYRNKDILYNVRYFDPGKNQLFDVTIYTFDQSFRISQTIYAAKAQWDGTQWVLQNGRVNITDATLRVPVSEAFDVRRTRLIEAPKSLTQIEYNAETMNTRDLLRAIQRHRALGINTSQWEVVLHARYSFLLVSVVFLALAFGLSMRFTRTGSYARDAAAAAGISLGYWAVFSFGVNLGNNGRILPVLAAWGPSLFSLVIVLIFSRFVRLRLRA